VSVDDRPRTSKGRTELAHSGPSDRSPKVSQMLRTSSAVRLSPPRGQNRDTLLGRSSRRGGTGFSRDPTHAWAMF